MATEILAPAATPDAAGAGNQDDLALLKALNAKPYKAQAVWFLNAFWKKGPAFGDNIDEAEKRAEDAACQATSRRRSAEEDAAQASSARASAEEDAESASNARESAEKAREQAEAARESANTALQTSTEAFQAAQAYLEQVKRECSGAGKGKLWWLDRELEEAKKYMSPAQLARLQAAPALKEDQVASA
ncbi:TolA protein, putative [Hondaea fermentalgiana]|uniref:TolA protein, putative n=1 Tax=Hondaea fermentalgiana TaxID=2315210 RepID=A0A2R5GHZ4_9STRA|nr:TolA protein, putative [Hondaea fermentalgiana]|eukprot:GBG27911.1 TolA protein, putative [Hondaea fermentalgiana]